MNSDTSPSDERSASLTAKVKLACIKQVLDRSDLSAQQKCVGVKLIAEGDKDWTTAASTADLQHAASSKDKETIFKATRRLAESGYISKASGRGQAGRFRILPPQVVDAVVEAYEEHKSGRVQSDQSLTKWSGKTGRVTTQEVVGLNPTTNKRSGSTGRVEPDQSGLTGRVQPDHGRAEVVNNNINKYNNLNNNPTSHSEQETAREGETHVGNGVFVNCESIRHRDFPISLKAIHLGVRAGALPFDEIKSRCLAHALQWAEEISHGKPARDVVPSKISNFLIRTIMNDINAEACSEVRLDRATKGTPTRRVAATGKTETEWERMTRLMGEDTAPRPVQGEIEILPPVRRA